MNLILNDLLLLTQHIQPLRAGLCGFGCLDIGLDLCQLRAQFVFGNAEIKLCAARKVETQVERRIEPRRRP